MSLKSMGIRKALSAPFSHSGVSVPRTMFLVVAALMPATLFGLYQFGWPAIIMFTLTIVSCVFFESVALMISGRSVSTFLADGSAILTGWLLALSMPPWAPWWLAVLGGFIAMILGKHIYGGLGQNIFNPAMVARVALLVSFPLEMTFYLQPQPLGAAGSPSLLQSLKMVFGSGFDFDALSSASTLTNLKVALMDGKTLSESAAIMPDAATSLVTALPGSLGELSAISLLAGGLFLIAMRIISWHTPVAMFGGMIVMATLFHLIDPQRYPDALYHILSGGFVLGAFFIATDYVTQPVSNSGRIVFGAGVGILTFLIRTYSTFPEGLGFAILLMNALTPMIDHYMKPRIFGRTRQGTPLPRESEKGA